MLQGQGLGGAQGQRQHDAAIDGAPLTRLACGSHLPSGLGLQGQEHSLPQNLTLPWASHREHTQVQARKPRTRELSPVPVAAGGAGCKLRQLVSRQSSHRPPLEVTQHGPSSNRSLYRQPQLQPSWSWDPSHAKPHGTHFLGAPVHNPQVQEEHSTQGWNGGRRGANS